MAEVVEPNLADTGPLQRPLEPLTHLATFERMAGVWMAEYKVIVRLIRGRLEEQLELAADPRLARPDSHTWRA